MLKKIFIPLGIAVFLSGYGQKIAKDIKQILPEGEHAFTVVHFSKKEQQPPIATIREIPPYEGHRSRTKATLSDKQVRESFDNRDTGEPTDMVVKSGDRNYRVVVKNNVITFFQEGNTPIFAVNVTSGEFISGNRRGAMKREEVTVSSSDNIFRSPWKGYRWKSVGEDSSGYDFTMARLTSNGKVYIEIQTPENTRYRLLSS